MVQILFLNVHAFLFAEFYVLWIADFNALLLAGKILYSHTIHACRTFVRQYLTISPHYVSSV
jgi:hypothetical protein